MWSRETALALHQLMDPSPPGMMQTLAMTFLHSEIGLSCSKFSFCTTTVLVRWGWFCEVLLHYIRTISLPLISWIALTLHQLKDPPLPGVLRWHFHISTSQDLLGLQQVQALHYYISTTSLRLILWIVFALHPYYFIDSAAGPDQLSSVWQIWDLHCASTLAWSLFNISSPNRRDQQGHHGSRRYVRETSVPWTSPSNMARG